MYKVVTTNFFLFLLFDFLGFGAFDIIISLCFWTLSKKLLSRFRKHISNTWMRWLGMDFLIAFLVCIE